MTTTKLNSTGARKPCGHCHNAIAARPDAISSKYGTAERLSDARLAIEHQRVRRVHEERRGAEVHAKAGAANATAVVDEDGRMTELVDEDQQEVEREEQRDPRSQRSRLVRQTVTCHHRRERDKSADGDEGGQHDPDRAEQMAKPMPIAPLGELLGPRPVDRQCAREVRQSSLHAGRGERPFHRGVDVDVLVCEKAAGVQRAHQVDNGRCVELTGRIELSHDDLTQRSRPVEQRQKIELHGVETVVAEVASVRDHAIDEAAPGLESFDLDPRGELGLPDRTVDLRRQRLPDVERCTHPIVDPECRRVDTTSVGGMTDETP